jgi:hypothetical protein
MLRGIIGASLLCCSPAFAFDLFAGPEVALQSITLWHDASGIDPVLGNPTSVLSYPLLVAPSLSVTAQGELSGWDYSAEVAVQGMGLGYFRDVDYLAGGTAFSDTVSHSSVDFGASARLKLLPDIVYDITPNWRVRPAFAAEAVTHTISNFGLACASVCPGPALPQSTEVIRQVTYGARVGGGVQLEMDLGGDGALEVGLLGMTGSYNVDDSHLLRPDLGSTPNILYRSLSTGVDAEVAYRGSIFENLDGYVKVTGSYDIGWGSATFRPATTTALTYPAGFNRVRLHLGAGLSGRF